MTEEKLEPNRHLLIFGNLAVLAWTFLAFSGLWFFNQISGWLLLIFNSRALSTLYCEGSDAAAATTARLAQAVLAESQAHSLEPEPLKQAALATEKAQ